MDRKTIALVKRLRDDIEKPNVYTVDHELTMKEVAERDCGSVDQFMDFLSYYGADMRIKKLLKLWYGKRLPNHDHPIFLDLLLRKLKIERHEVYRWAAEGAYHKLQQMTKFKMALEGEKVLDMHLEEARSVNGVDRGFKDRHLFAKISGILPTARGTQINVQQNNQNTAQAKADSIGSELPKFETDRQAISQLVRAED